MTEATPHETPVPGKPGTYALLLRCTQPRTVRVGALGVCALEPGAYLYIGSARGAGGLRARLRHHVRRSGIRHWHLDYIRPHLRPVRVWYANPPLEHRWSRAIGRLVGVASPFRGFGASDCRCPTHLFHSTESGFAEAVEDALARGARGASLRSTDAITLRGLCAAGARGQDGVR